MARNEQAWEAHNARLWDEITEKLFELLRRDEIDFMPTLEGLQAELFLKVSIDDITGNAEFSLRNNVMTDECGAPVNSALVIPKSIYRQMVREKETAVRSLVKRHGKRSWDRLVARSQPVEAMQHIEILSGRL